MPTTSDFSEILELQQFRKLYEEQEEKTRLRLTERDEQIARLQQAQAERDEQIQQLRQQLQGFGQERERLRADYNRLRQEAQEKIDKLMERIKELNQKLTGEEKRGMFR